jgi:hypothetical protein
LTKKFFTVFGCVVSGQSNAQPTGQVETSGQLTVSQAARALGLDAFTCYTLLQRDRIPYAFGAGGEIMISELDLNHLLAKG